MEKFSAFRDPSTGIAPFLTPLPSHAPSALIKFYLPFGAVIGAVRTALVILLGVLHVLVVDLFCSVLKPIPPLHRALSGVITALLARLALFIVGFVWIPVEPVTKKRSRGGSSKESWNPRPGDIIVSNWASWVEVLYLAFRFNPIFVLPISAPIERKHDSPSAPSPGRRTGTGSAAISSSAPSAQRARAPILGFQEVSLWQIVFATGHVPQESNGGSFSTLEDIRKRAKAPVVVFPECTTSNGRGLLRFANIFPGKSSVPVRGYNVFVMCARYDPPTWFNPTPTLPIPSTSTLLPNPIAHIFSLTSAPNITRTMSIRLLAPSESPSSGSFLASDVITGPTNDEISEACAVLIAQLGKMKRTQQGWEDKTAFLEFYHGKNAK